MEPQTEQENAGAEKTWLQQLESLPYPEVTIPLLILLAIVCFMGVVIGIGIQMQGSHHSKNREAQFDETRERARDSIDRISGGNRHNK